jgi:membrane peptidoglycan carboxypeptidase
MRTRRAIAAHNLKTTRSGKVKRRGIVWRMRRWLFLAGLLAVTGVAGLLYLLSTVDLPAPPKAVDQTTFVCDASVPLGRCTSANAMAAFHGSENRIQVGLDRIPEVMQDAVLASEDRDFFEHGGVDPAGIARAAWADIRNKGAKQGGSTITQQYVKTVYLSSDRTLGRKIKEAAMAVKFEQEYSKKEILELYLNTIYFGRGAYGVQAASQAYFGLDVSDLGLSEAALLAGLIRNPRSAEPYTHPEEAKRRRRTVLDAMLEEKMITPAEHRAADTWPFSPFHGLKIWTPSQGVDVLKGGDPKTPDQYAATQYFIESVRKEMERRYGEDTLYSGGLRIYTTLDLGMQKAAYDSITGTLDQPGDPEGAMVAIDDQGQVKAMMGGRDTNADVKWAKVNLATGRAGGGTGRQPGSTFKAFALAEAIREGYSIDSLFESPSQKIFPNANGGADWTVRGGCCGGRTDLATATEKSVNTVYAQLMLRLGVDKVDDMAYDLGISQSADLPLQPAVVLGAGEVSVLDMASAYSTFANQGVRITPRTVVRVERADGTVVDDFAPQRAQVLTADQAAKVNYALGRVVESGPGEAAQIGRPQAGKTGTTQNNADAWFVGYTPKLTAAVWMGRPEGNASMGAVHGIEAVQGGTLPAQMWKRFMEVAVANIDTGSFPPLPPSDVLEAGTDLNPQLRTTLPPPTTAPPATEPEPEKTTTTDKKDDKPPKKDGDEGDG